MTTKRKTKKAAVAKYADVKAAKQLAERLQDVPDHMLACRRFRHAWATDRSFYPYEVVQESGSTATFLATDLGCMRGCGYKVTEVYLLRRFRGGTKLERVDRFGDYPPGYLLPGMPRGVKPLSIVQQEVYRRAMEVQAKAPRGDRATADGDRHARRA